MTYSSLDRPLTFYDIFSSVWRYKVRVTLVTCSLLVLSAAAVFLFPKKYESEAKLFVRMGRGSASLDPATVGQTISILESRETEMNSIVDMLQSRGLAERIVEQVGHERLLKKYAKAEILFERWRDAAMEFLATNLPVLEEVDAASGDLPAGKVEVHKDFELAVKELSRNLKIDSPKKSTTIGIVFRARTPQLAKDVVDQVLESYRDMHIDAYQSGGTLDFFGKQFDEQQRLVSETEDELRRAKNENSIVTMDGQQQSLQTQITDVKKMQLETKAALQAANAKVVKLQLELDELPRELVSEKTQGIAENATDSMRNRLYELEIQEKDLASKFSASHPQLITVREQLANARNIVDEQPREREQTRVAVNPIRLDIENKMLLAQADVSSLEAKIDALGTLEGNLVERLNRVNDLEVMTYDMQRKIDIARENHRSYARKLEESRINAALDQDAVSNVSVVARPTVRYKHVSPKRSILAAISVLFSVICGVAVAMISEASANAKENRRIREAERKRLLAGLGPEPTAAVAQAELPSEPTSSADAETTPRTPGKAK